MLQERDELNNYGIKVSVSEKPMKLGSQPSLSKLHHLGTGPTKTMWEVQKTQEMSGKTQDQFT